MGFTVEDNHLLVDMKENKSLSWDQIAEFFPGRTSGMLQDHYSMTLQVNAILEEEKIALNEKKAEEKEEDISNSGFAGREK
jgi:hypothetical protein